MAEQPAASRLSETSAPPDAFPLPFVKLWVWLCALAGLAGWSLSAIGQLNRAGYAVFFGVAAAIFFACHRRSRWARPNWKKLRGRFHRPFPRAFALLAVLVFCGSAFYPPTNYTGLSYHLGRVLQWLAHGQWWWIHTPVMRMNYSGCAFEWLTTPLVLFTKTDRALFLVNFSAFLLLPGLVFSVLTRLGVRSRVAWYWMWLFAGGYNLLLQAGSIDNDAIGAVFALAAIDFACRAWASRRVQDLWVSLLAVALLTGTKPTSLPLLLPWAILVLPLLPLLWRSWLPTVPVAVLAGFASFLPLALMNQLYSGDWLGRTVEAYHKEIHQPLVGVFGNAFQLALGNFLPPVFPPAGWWNTHALLVLPHAIVQAIGANFEPGILVIGEVPTEDISGVGFGVSWLLVVSLLASLWLKGKSAPRPVPGSIPRWLCRCVMVAAWLSLLAYSMKAGMNTAARLVSSYYLLLTPLLLAGTAQAQIVRRCWWRVLAGGTLVLALVVLVLSPDRPLWPAQTVLSKVLAEHPDQPSVTRALQVYTVYSHRNDVLAGVRQLLPPGLGVVGFVGDGDDCDISLWRPFGSRRVEHFLLQDPPELIRSRVQYVVVGGYNLLTHGTSIDDWLQHNNAGLVATTNATVKVGEGQQLWYLTRLRP